MFDWLRKNATITRLSSKKTTVFICLWILSIFLFSCDGSGSDNDRAGAGSDLRQRSNYPPVVFMADKDTNNTVELYAMYRQSDPNDSSWIWPEGLVPICHWGCAIYSCVDCKDEKHPVVIFDPNMYDESWSQCFIPHKDTFEAWISAWADGVNLWNEVYGEC